MLLTLSSTADHATDLGFLLHKHPDRVQTFDLPVGQAHVFYPEATDERCTVALLLEVDPVALVQGRRWGADGFALTQYVNDRPYAASSMLAVALGKVFNTALKGQCAARPELATQPLPLVVRVPALPTGGDSGLVERLFAPLGWELETHTAPLHHEMPQWGESPYVDATLTGEMVLSEALGHLYVLLPVLDGAKHYWVSSDEVDKLVRNAAGWLGEHPERDLITRRYLAHQRKFVLDATERLAALDDNATSVTVAPNEDSSGHDPVEVPRRKTLALQRRHEVVTALHDVAARRVVDLGCGEGALLADLLDDPQFTEVLGADVSVRELDRAGRRLGLDRMPDSKRDRLTLRQSSATYRDQAIRGFDAVVLMEVIEHLDLERLPALETSVFAHARPRVVVVTTPNADYNPLYEGIAAGAMRHSDHRFEWGTAGFTAWAQRVGRQFGYAAELRPVGEVHADLGPATQLALFCRDGDPT